MAPHKPIKSAPTEYTTVEEDMIVYDMEDEPEPNAELILNLGGYTYKGEFVNEPNQRFIRYDFDNTITKNRIRKSKRCPPRHLVVAQNPEVYRLGVASQT
ncbi:hypothetical protein TNCV_3603281 [Trichonephila clavipes]|nr:hypothetical protein TNCV_3603281 [Trichonephila clavipes]